MKHYGLFGEHLSHSKSPEIQQFIYNLIGFDADYSIYEFEKNNIQKYIDMIRDNKINGANVTIPYKKDILPYIDILDEKAKDIGAINTIFAKDNILYGYNTDYYGISKTLESYLPIENKDYLILGYGGASQPLIHFLADNRAKNIYIASRDPKRYNDFKINAANVHFIDYKNIKNLCGEIIFNTTPLGMFPNVDSCPVDEDLLKNFKVAIDFIYNPVTTKFLSSAKNLGLKTQNGLKMLVYQAIESIQIWSGKKINESIQRDIYMHFRSQLYTEEKIYLVGLPASGKTTFAKVLADYLGYNFLDLDQYIENSINMSVSDIFEKYGEDRFRQIESQALKDTCNMKNTVIATGGGIVEKEENRKFLKGFDNVFYLKRDIKDILDTVNLDERPILRNSPEKLYTLYKKRHSFYEDVSNHILNNNSTLNKLLLDAIFCF
ncbi:MAG: shikimate dehydrogenase [Peptostreptococcus sp.]|uniref:shikimate dehydrogenase n=1 Tax=Peptostreptococcus sp. TaxID=1262 RepID=UPI002FC995E8